MWGRAKNGSAVYIYSKSVLIGTERTWAVWQNIRHHAWLLHPCWDLFMFDWSSSRHRKSNTHWKRSTRSTREPQGRYRVVNTQNSPSVTRLMCNQTTLELQRSSTQIRESMRLAVDPIYLVLRFTISLRKCTSQKLCLVIFLPLLGASCTALQWTIPCRKESCRSKSF